MIIGKRFTFEAAHYLPNHEGKCIRLHGHTYQLFIEINGVVSSNKHSAEYGMVMDYSRFTKIIKEVIIQKLDHSYLNDLIENPTAENILMWIVDRLKKEFYEDLCCVILQETENTWARWGGYNGIICE